MVGVLRLVYTLIELPFVAATVHPEFVKTKTLNLKGQDKCQID